MIPTRNRADLLRRAIESVLAQTYARFELVVADNASEDHTADVVAGFAAEDRRVRHVRRDRDIGFVANFERSLEDLRTDFVTLLPDDDVMRPQKLEVGVAIMDANPRVGLLHSRFDEIDRDGRPLRSDVDPTHGRLRADAIEPGVAFIREAVSTSRHVVFPTAFVRTAALPSPRFVPADGLAIDLGLWLRIALDWDVAFVARPLAAVRSHGTMLSSSSGFFSRGRYVQGFDMVRLARDAKVRFLLAHGSRLPDRDRLLREAERVARRHMLGAVWNLRVGAGRLGPSVRMLAGGIRAEPRLLADPTTYGLAAALLLGPAVGEPVRERLYGRGGRPVEGVSRGR